jgi:ribose/xylose/arabinose/galactoside ABC-type transport system permease subunit
MNNKKILNFIFSNINLIILLILIICSSLISPYFLTSENILNVVRATSLIGIVAIGMNVVMITGGIDLSVGSLVALTGALAASLWVDQYQFLFIFIPILAALIVGLLNGFIVTVLNLQPFIATLILMTVVRGTGLVFTGGQPIYADYPDYFSFLSKGYILNIPVPALIFLIITLFSWYMLKFQSIGRYIYAIGSNANTSFLSGVKITKIKIVTYVYCSLLAGIAGLILTSRMQSGEPGQAGLYWELDAIAAVVIGGTSLLGGKGSVWGAFVGAFIIGVLSNMFNLLGVDPEWQYVSKGLIIFIAVLIQSIENSEKIKLYIFNK